ncbi:hypothetical protein [Streptomyces sparsogenes]|uniref:Uncharacterized protein n=1 Tax=Streptomyces sparsogenes DSM 40356 TaxID=1331668 RepID=A0A1R1SL97_9ACTN|nr:hypothetical protein [Streptomyces sparsogenes]OMI39074.1 hypothetical protein SPAR_12668 [Streptomyces sparsogenes DSM 40356]
MFQSLSTSTWILIAAGATLVNLAAMQWIIEIPQYRTKQLWMPVIGIIAVGGNSLAQGDGPASTCYQYTVLMIMMPVALAPVRRQITRDYYRWVQNPATKPSKGAMVWVTTSILVMVVAAVLLWQAEN